MKERRGSSESFSERSLLLFLLLEECFEWAVWLFMGFFFLLLLLFEAKLPAGHTKPDDDDDSQLFFFSLELFILFSIKTVCVVQS